jgi:primosomal protein N' (replication factor Y)
VPRAVDVLLPLPLAPLRWLAPFGRDPGPIGSALVVPWRDGLRTGLVTGLAEVPPARALELKEAVAWLADGPPLPEPTVRWLLAEAERTASPPGLVLAGLSWPPLRLGLEHEVRELDAAGGPPGPWRDAARVEPARLQERREQGLLEERVRPATGRRRLLVPADAAEGDALAGARRAAQRRALARLREDGAAESGAALARTADVPESAVRTLVRKGLARYEERREAPPAAPPPPEARPWPPTAAAFAPPGSLPEDGAPSPAQGVPAEPGPPHEADPPAGWIDGGDVAARLAALLPELRRDLAAGRCPVLLAPERALAERAAGWLAGALPVRRMRLDDPPERRRAWERALAAGPPAAVVGTWPVLAAPLPAAGRLALLEANAESHKARSGARSWAPAAAVGWAAAHGVPLRLGDVLAGPETRALVRSAGGGTQGVRLPRPRVRWLTSDLGATRSWPLGDELIRVLRQVEARARQALLLVPRRGFSAALGCRDCGAAVMCPNCDLALRWHAREGRLRCHQCGHDVPPPAACPACGAPELEAQRAAGSEWVLRALAGVAPELPRYRWDGDVRDDLTPLREGAPGVVVGTTALLRLAPLPVLSLLAVTQVDGGLHADDFRAEERALRTLLALQETAGRRTPLGLIQTFAPEHPLLRDLVAGRADALDGAVARMDERRRRFGYPPYGRLARIQASARREDAAWRAAEAVAERLRAAGAAEEELLGPAPAPVARVRGRSLVHLLLRSEDEARRRELLRAALAGSSGGARLRVDVDPRDIGEVLE